MTAYSTYYEIAGSRALLENSTIQYSCTIAVPEYWCSIRSTGKKTILKQFVPISQCMWVLSAELVLNLVLNLASMDTKFSAGGDGSHPGAASAAVLFLIPTSIPIYAARAFPTQF